MKTKLKKYKVLIVVILVLAVSITATGIFFWSGKKKVSAGGTQQTQSTISLEKMDLTKSISATGTIQSKMSKTVSANVNDIQVKQVNVSVGDKVTKGDVLVAFDESDLQETLSDARESLSTAKEEADNNISSAKSKLSEARKTYTSEKKKTAEQVAKVKKEKAAAQKQVSSLKKQISAEKDADSKAKLEEQLSKAEEVLKQAETSYENAVSEQENTEKQNKTSVETAKEEVETAESNRTKNVKEAQKQVDEAQKNLESCSVTAPISGIVTAVNVEEGDTYSGGDMFQIDDNSGYTVSTTVDEYDISSVSVGQRVVILTEATDEDELEGEITFVAPSAGSTSLSTGTAQSGDSGTMSSSSSSSSEGYEVEIAIETADERLKMGMTAKCSVILEEAEDVYAVPYDAVHDNSDGTSVIYVTESNGNSTASREVQVTKGMESDYYVEISSQELSDGMNVVIPTDASSSSSADSSDKSELGMFGSGSGAPSGGQMGGNKAPGGSMGGPGM